MSLVSLDIPTFTSEAISTVPLLAVAEEAAIGVGTVGIVVTGEGGVGTLINIYG